MKAVPCPKCHTWTMEVRIHPVDKKRELVCPICHHAEEMTVSYNENPEFPKDTHIRVTEKQPKAGEVGALRPKEKKFLME